MDKLRVILVDDHQMIMEGLQNMIGPDSLEIEVIGTGCNGAEAVVLAGELHPDIILMDIRMPIKDGIAATREIKQAHPEIYVIVLTTFDDDSLIVQALQAGADGYLLKDVSATELRAALRGAAQGQTSISPAVAAKLARHVAQAGSAAEAVHEEVPEGKRILTEREMEILQLIVLGYDNLAIAKKLCISWGTAKNYISRIYARLGVSRRSQLVKLYHSAG